MNKTLLTSPALFEAFLFMAESMPVSAHMLLFNRLCRLSPLSGPSVKCLLIGAQKTATMATSCLAVSLLEEMWRGRGWGGTLAYRYNHILTDRHINTHCSIILSSYLVAIFIQKVWPKTLNSRFLFSVYHTKAPHASLKLLFKSWCLIYLACVLLFSETWKASMGGVQGHVCLTVFTCVWQKHLKLFNLQILTT